MVFFVHQSMSMTQEEIQEIMAKSANYNNYSILLTKTEQDKKTQRTIITKDNICIQKMEDTYRWTNYTTGEEITISYLEKTATLESIPSKEYNLFNSEAYKEYQYKYLGEIQKEGKDYASIAYKSDTYYVEALFDLDLGINIKEEFYDLEGKMRKGNLVMIYDISNIEIGTITKQEVEKPDLTGYKIIDKRD